MAGMEQPTQVSLLTEIGGSSKFSVGIAHPFRTHRANLNDPSIQLTIVHYDQEPVLGHSDLYYFPLGSLDSGNDV